LKVKQKSLKFLVDVGVSIKVERWLINHGYDRYINLEYEGNKYNPREARLKGLKTLRDMELCNDTQRTII